MDLSLPTLLGFIIGLAGAALALFGGILVMIAAFNESLLWGLCYIFVPFAKLAFLILHWAEAKKGFFISLLGLAVFAGSFGIAWVAADPAAKSALVARGFKVTTTDRGETTSQKNDSTSNGNNFDRKVQIQTEITATQGEIAALQAKVNEEYPRLSERRKTLKTSDPQAVQAFNLLVATYNQDNQELAAKNQRLSQLWKEHDALAQESSRLAREERANTHEDSLVVLYTTSWCPACKSAKAYLAQKGISYQEKDVEKSREAAEEFHRRGGGGVPMVVINGRQMTGFSPEWVQEQLAQR
jgi:glutaredoxin